MTIDASKLANALDAIRDPVSGKGLIAAGRSAAPRASDGVASVILDATGLAGAVRESLELEIRQQLGKVAGVQSVRVAMTSEKRSRRIIAVGSGKGGVGKSTLAANIAITLRRLGCNVGLVDADIYGPSQPRLMSAEDVRPTAHDKRLEPVQTRFGVPMLSMGQLVEPGKAIAWRGPMIGSALSQMVDADWGEVDLLILDLPPGTGDVQLSMIQKHKPAGAVIVSTPQDLALMDATRALDLFRQANVPIIGLIENMAGYVCPHCGDISDPFGSGGAEHAARSLDVPFLGRIPLNIDIRRASDAGTPPAALEDDVIFKDIATAILAWVNNSARQGL